MFNTRNTLLKSLQETATSGGYPPYNIAKDGTDKYVIEIAAAGSTIDEFDITCNGGDLRVVCTPKKKENVEYIRQGLTYKKWTREFALNVGVTTKGAELTNGILRVFLEYTAPKVNSTKIEIRQGGSQVLHG